MLSKIITETMAPKSYFFVSLIVVSILTIFYFILLYYDSGIQNIFLKAYRIHEIDGLIIDDEETDSFSLRFARATKYRQKGIKTILLWNTLFGDKNFYFGEDNHFRGCPVDRCKIITEQGYMNEEDFDAILFHGNELNEYEVPKKRKITQFYVFVNLESPVNRPISNWYFEDYFNLTMTYRLDSDIPWTYGVMQDVKSGRFVAPSRNIDWNALQNNTSVNGTDDMPILDFVKGKSKLISWFVSNCNAKSGRMKYVHELLKYIDVDVYGRCGTLNCDRELDCFSNIVEPQYFFYLSFENSLCDDYVTEKLRNPFRYNIVPVVYGGANYSQFAPPKSYVNALDFDNPKKLAAYLKYLSQDLRQYQSFLQWKRYYRAEGGTKQAACNLCEVLHKQTKPKQYLFLSKWYAKDKCPIQNLLDNSNNQYATKQMLINHTYN